MNEETLFHERGRSRLVSATPFWMKRAAVTSPCAGGLKHCFKPTTTLTACSN